MNWMPQNYAGTPGRHIVRGAVGMFGRGKDVKSFGNAEAFNAYVAAVRSLGRTVRFETPFVAVIEPRQQVAQ